MKIFTPQFTKDILLIAVFIAFFYLLTHNPFFYPKPEPTPGAWSIQLMQHPLVLGLAGHNYLVLRNPNETIIQELHGLATDSTTGEWKYIGADKTDILTVWKFDGSKKYLAEKRFPGIILAEGDEQKVRTLWEQADACKNIINQKKLSYPRFGVSFLQETENSNSVAYTLALCMEVDIRHIGLITPGSRNNLLDTQ